MEEDTVIALPRPGSGVMDDPLLAVLREGARRMLTQAIESEVEAFLAAHAGLVDQHGRRRLVRNGHAPERRLQTGIGPLEVRRPKLRDRGRVADGGPIRFTSAVLPAYLRRTKNIEELLPWLYLKGVSTGQFAEALTALLGPEAPGLSPATVRRLTAGWQDEHERWQRRDLSARRYVYLWADGVYFAPRLEHERQCLLVLIGADASGRKELLAVEDGFRESAQSWRELLLRLGCRPPRSPRASAAASRVLPRHQPDPGREVPAAAELTRVPDAGDQGRGDDRADRANSPRSRSTRAAGSALLIPP